MDNINVWASPRRTLEIATFPVTGLTCKAVYCEGAGSAGQLTYKHRVGDTAHTLTLADNQDKALVIEGGEITSFTGTNLKVYDW